MFKKLLLSAILSFSFLSANNLTSNDKNITQNINVFKGLHGNYNKGFKYYRKYFKKSGLGTSSEFIKNMNLKNSNVTKIFIPLAKGNFEKFKKNLTKHGYKNINDKKLLKINKKPKKIIHIIKFLNGILNGKIPAGCS